ncbi:MAG: hypothetical protein WCT41_02210 [Candidatus Paceibacterota bacterium]|jgi:hypothetical protein
MKVLSKNRNKENGDIGEQEIVDLISCPNCTKRLMLLPQSYPLYDVQCIACSFRAQIKTNLCKPKPIIFGAGWEIIDKVLKSGFLVPPLLVNFKWIEKEKNRQEVRFYPFIPKTNLKKRFTTIKKSGRELWMFNYVGLDKLPYFDLYIK